MKSAESQERVYFEDIIFAQATPNGVSAIAVIRVSGKGSIKILEKIFSSHRKEQFFFQSHHAYYGNIVSNGQILDDVVVVVFGENKSFTGEESFEISCHGSQAVVSMLMKVLIDSGCRIAEPGEFSKRAFLNGRISLNEAEAIADVINSSTAKSALIAVQQLSGRLTDQIDNLKEKLADLLSGIEVFIDYPEEDISHDNEKWLSVLSEMISDCDDLLSGYIRGKYYREGINAVILGKTNSGKSTLFNFLLNDDKAIVSDIHGTTRDYLDAVINIEGYGIRLFDTAGLRVTDDPIELEGTKRSVELSVKSDIILYIVDGNSGFKDDDRSNLLGIKSDKKTVVIINKVDMIPDGGSGIGNEIEAFLVKNKKEYFKIVRMSALKKEGLDEFNDKFVSMMNGEQSAEKDDPVVTNLRHSTLIGEARNYLSNAYEKLEDGLLDLAAFELREALDKLGEITGEITSVDILNRIFDNFCVGK
jgi:tRNA modification GTPase